MTQLFLFSPPALEGWHLLYTDGAARGNPGPAAIACVLKDPKGQTIASHAAPIGSTTNNFAEYLALIAGLKLARQHGVDRLRVLMDSELLVRQLTGAYRVRNPRLLPLYEEASRLLGDFEAVEIRHIPRSENAEADALANLVLDQAAEAQT
ncbi:MAG: hypothetical protein KatS3mg115_1302 [Candidatus Poribacteria bacterium]|nr:MAG: hypothetical protein KatS3mg115_1302 [Candidatus Poribacteria bacterium]